ncbi:MAG: RNA methyltransferase, partial [Odoribacteraceae bacterium]|nr:RNA methyltransferase [Odoribacteraceae bacterium]
HAGFVRCLEGRVGVLYKGVEVMEGDAARVSHALALWAGLPRERVATREVDLETASRFLRKEDARLDVPRGEWAVVTYHSIALGWVKGVGGRVNNYYPKEWRVRTGGG